MNRPAASQLSPDVANKLRDTAKIVGWGLALYGAVSLAGSYLAQNPAGAAAIQAVIAEFGAGRIAIAWSDPRAPLPTTVTISRRAGRGAAMGAGAAVLVLGFALVTRGASLAHNSPTPSMLALGLLMAGLYAMRDELLLRGVVLRALEHSAPAPVALLVCGLAGAAARVGVILASSEPPSGIPWGEALVAGLLAVSFAALWRRDRGAWLPWGAHTAWLWMTGAVAHGGLVDIRWAPGLWGGGDGGVQASMAAAAALALVSIVAVRGSGVHTAKTAFDGRALG